MLRVSRGHNDASGVLTLLLRFTLIILAAAIIRANVVNGDLIADDNERNRLAFSCANCFAALSEQTAVSRALRL